MIMRRVWPAVVMGVTAGLVMCTVALIAFVWSTV